MFEKLNTTEELLGAALKMKNTVLETLGDLEEASQRLAHEQFAHAA